MTSPATLIPPPRDRLNSGEFEVEFSDDEAPTLVDLLAPYEWDEEEPSTTGTGYTPPPSVDDVTAIVAMRLWEPT